MMHKRRTWCVGSTDTPEELARKLTESTWCLCNGFEIQGYLFLNDATGENGAQEYAVVKRCADGTFKQVESITMSWCSFDKALGYIRKAIAGEMDGYDFVSEVRPKIDTPEEHGTCQLCA